MSINAKARKTLAVITVISCLMSAQSAQAFCWPVMDIGQITSFISNVTNGISQISNVKSQIENATQTISAVGDQISSIKKFATDLKNTITSIKENINNMTDGLKSAVNSVTDAVKEAGTLVNDFGDKTEEVAKNTEAAVNEQVENGATEDDVKIIIDEAQKEVDEHRQEIKTVIEETAKVVNENLDKTKEAVNEFIKALDGYEELTPEQRQEFKERGEEINKKIDALRAEAIEILKEIEEKFDKEYSEKITQAFAEYNQAVSDYYAGKISLEDLQKAGKAFNDKISSFNIGVDKERLKNLVDSTNKVAEELDNLKEEVLNVISNSQDYSDEDGVEEVIDKEALNTQYINSSKQYVFNFKNTHENIFLKSQYAKDEDKSFLISDELNCDGEIDFEQLIKSPTSLRRCVVMIKNEDPEKDNLYNKKKYKKFKENGVYHHVVMDYGTADIININAAKQFATAWGSLADDNKNGTHKRLREQLQNSPSQADAVQLMSLIDIEAPKLWSKIRRRDALDRSKTMVQEFNVGQKLYLDDGDEDYRNGTNANRGTVRDGSTEKNVFPNVFLDLCYRATNNEIKAEDISLSWEEKTGSSRSEKMEEKEKNIADCLYAFTVKAAGRTLENESNKEKPNIEAVMQEWKLKERKAYNDAAFNNFTLSVINNYKSSLDTINPRKLPESSKGQNIQQLLKEVGGIKNARENYSVGAKINYYSGMQLLSMVDADALNQETEILKDLMTFTYNYFGQSTDEKANKGGSE